MSVSPPALTSSCQNLSKAEAIFRRVVAISPQDGAPSTCLLPWSSHAAGNSFATIAILKLAQWLRQAEYSFANENPFDHITPIIRHVILRVATRLDPMSAYVKYVHAAYMLRCEKNGTVAVDELRQAIVLEPNNEDYYGLLAQAFETRAGEYRAELVTDAQTSKWIIKRTEDLDASSTAQMQYCKIRLKAERGLEPEELEREVAAELEKQAQQSPGIQSINLVFLSPAHVARREALLQALQSFRDDTYFSSLDKRTLSQSDWFTTIGKQAR
eukprot:767776-Hanusia_phi.AAC.4